METQYPKSSSASITDRATDALTFDVGKPFAVKPGLTLIFSDGVVIPTALASCPSST